MGFADQIPYGQFMHPERYKSVILPLSDMHFIDVLQDPKVKKISDDRDDLLRELKNVRGYLMHVVDGPNAMLLDKHHAKLVIDAALSVIDDMDQAIAKAEGE